MKKSKYDNYVPAIRQTPYIPPTIVERPTTGTFGILTGVCIVFSGIFSIGIMGIVSYRYGISWKMATFATLLVWSIAVGLLLPRLADRFYPEVENFSDTDPEVGEW